VIFCETRVAGVLTVDLERNVDERGFFARTWCADEFARAGLPDMLVQCSVSWNERRHTLRGLHWQAAPYGEAKLVRCTAGAVLDVVVDVRPGSPTFLANDVFEIDANERRSVFVPPGVAHGFLTLTDGAEVFYQMDTAYVPDAARGARWDDPAFSVPWPAPPAVISARDRSFPDFEPSLMTQAHR
jgi:dTDP-4-dehydrorhamnose 3,5-epimerase